MSWAQNTRDQPVYWLNGLAGTGKSTIAQTFSEMASDCGILGATFFCSRDYLDRNVLKNIFPTLAYQLACHYPRFRDHLVKVVRRDPSVAHNSLISQLRDLIVDPLSATWISCVIVIDALDECVDDQPASAILSVVGRLITKLPLVKLLITGRPEPRIRSGFRLPLLEPFTQVFLLHEVEPTSVGGDIRLYLTEKLTAIAKRRSDLDLSEVWPSDEDIAVLVKKSSGLFIFASTVVRFIESEHHDPRERLQLTVSKADDTRHEGASGVDLLYSQVLRDAFFGIDEESVFVDLNRILGAVVLALNPLSRDGLVQLLNVDSVVISTRLRHLHSVILVPTDGAKEIRVFHKSFPDFLQDLSRCRDPRFHIDRPGRHGEMALSCLDLVGKLKMNPCGLHPFVMNEDVSDRSQRIDELGSGLRYACEYWSTHLLLSSSSAEHDDRLIASTSLFFYHAVFPWMEVMSLEDHMEGVIHSMNHLLDWPGTVSGVRCSLYRDRFLTTNEWKARVPDSSIHDPTNDCLRFALHFFRPMQISAQHIYHTALPLSPEGSILRSRFFENHSPWREDMTTQQVSSSSIPTTWGPIFRTIKTDSGNFTHVTVAGQRIIAMCEDNIVNMYDAVTGVLRLSLNPPQQVTKAESSPDGSVLFFAHQRAREITVWDTQTGGMIYNLTTVSDISDISVSSRGKYLGSCSSDGTFEFWGVESRFGGSYSLDQAVICICWLEPEDRVALAFERFIVILDVAAGRTLQTYRLGGSFRGITFSAHQHKLAVLLAQEAEVRIWIIDIRTGAVQESPHTLHDVSCLTFPYEDQVICAANNGDLLSYDIFSSRWTHHLSHLGTTHSMGNLRSGHLVISSGESIRLLGLGSTQQSRTNRDPEIVHVHSSQNDNLICGSSKDHESATLLAMETMRIVANHHTKPDERDDSFAPLLCASMRREVAVFRFRKQDGFALRGYTDSGAILIWEQLLLRPVLFGTLPPHGKYFITVDGGEDPSGDGGWEICVRKTSTGVVLNVFPFMRTGRPPSKIVFTSGDQFYTEERRVFHTPPWDEDGSNYEDNHEDKGDYEDHHVQTASTPSTAVKHLTPETRSIPRATVSKQPEVRHTTPHVRDFVTRRSDKVTTSTTNSGSQPRAGVRHKEYLIRKTFSLKTVGSRIEIEEVPGEEILPVLHPYSLDENLEWVLDAESRRVCWLPPGYVTGIEDGHFFVGSSIVTAGQDGIVRKLTFREPKSDP